VEYSVVIPARDAARTLPRVLDALAVREPRPLEVIVVDGGSSDETARIAEEHGARVVAPGGRSFAGGARNAGWEQVRGEAVVFLDADVVPGTGWLPVVYRRVVPDAELRRRFLALLPRLAVAEWTLGASAVRQAARRPALRGGPQPLFE
jgi:glycosyltransferase involved in cell wall biosynthesis